MPEQTNEPSAPQEGTEQVNPGQIRKSTTQSILKAVSQAAGTEFDSVEALAAALARLSATSAQPQPQRAVEPQEQAPKRLTTNDLQEQFVSLKQDLAKKEQALREKELDADIRMAMGDTFDPDLLDYALSKVKTNIAWEDGTYAIVNQKGQMRYNDSGNPMSLQDLVREVAKGNPKLLKVNSGNTGSGLRVREGNFGGEAEVMPDYITDPAGFNAWASRNGLGKGAGLKGVKASVSVSNTSKKIY